MIQFFLFTWDTNGFHQICIQETQMAKKKNKKKDKKGKKGKKKK